MPFVAQIGEIVLVPGSSGESALHVAGVAEQGAGLTQQVQRDVAQCDVLFDLRGPGDPFPQPLGENQRVISQSENVGGKRSLVDLGLVDVGSVDGAVDML